MLEEIKNRLLDNDRLVGISIVAIFALFLIVVPPIYGVTQIKPLGMSLLAGIALSFFN
ncbi:MAG: hypothetical protein ACQESO_06255 [Bacillota bacterium]